jgi:hypothetical protein
MLNYELLFNNKIPIINILITINLFHKNNLCFKQKKIRKIIIYT